MSRVVVSVPPGCLQLTAPAQVTRAEQRNANENGGAALSESGKRASKKAVLLVVFFGWFQFAYWTSTNDCDSKTGTPTHPMKAIRYCEYGSPDDVLKLEQVEKPVPSDTQILVRVRAVSLRFFDGGMLQGGVGRLIFGLRKPKNTCPGSDYSGTVEAIGKKRDRVQAGR